MLHIVNAHFIFHLRDLVVETNHLGFQRDTLEGRPPVEFCTSLGISKNRLLVFVSIAADMIAGKESRSGSLHHANIGGRLVGLETIAKEESSQTNTFLRLSTRTVEALRRRPQQPLDTGIWEFHCLYWRRCWSHQRLWWTLPWKARTGSRSSRSWSESQ